MYYILDLLSYKMSQPVAFSHINESWFQYLATLLWLVFMVYAFIKYKGINEDKLTRIIFSVGLLILTFELYKQIVFTYDAMSFQWYAFPFQFCSTPMYTMVIQRFTRGRIKTALWTYLQTYGFFAGVAVMLYPISVFHPIIGINIQTMVHHGGMAYIGFLLILIHRPSIKAFMDGTIVFICVTILAVIMNSLFNLSGNPSTFNMFFLNPKFDSHIPVISLFQDHVSWITYDLIFLLGFIFIGYIMLMFNYAWHKKALKIV
ncbi:TMEM164 family acyltransferase [Liberiplasma polymorphum]|uniref:TMEM164 family acyltransferase n=1 Tax=Liberiplasma polymorphum TaxID=3374570 RepID=UPI003773199C